MKTSGKWVWLAPGLAAAAGLLVLVLWLTGGLSELALRIPGTDHSPEGELGANANAVLAGSVNRSDVPAPSPAAFPGAWPQFRGPNRDAFAKDSVPLLRAWQPSDPRELWSVDVGEGYAGAAVLNGRVYLMDYSRQKKQDALRCLSLADGKELWRYSYPVSIKRNHGMTRTVPAATDQLVVAIGPKCHVACCNPVTGDLLWGMDMVRQFGTTIPPWYAGQCPMVDGGAVILAPCGTNVLLTGVDGITGTNLWQTPNPHGWKMTHSSIMPMEFEGERMFVYCANNGVVGVSARDGRILWETTDWKISIATVPSPLILPGGRIFLSGGYSAGSLMLQLQKQGSNFVAQTVYKLPPGVFGAIQHTPIFYEDRLYGVREDGRFVCLTLEGKPAWVSDSSQSFGLGSFLLADGLILAMNDKGLLRLIEATPGRYNLLGQAQVIKAETEDAQAQKASTEAVEKRLTGESWAPLALAGGRLIVRDLTRMVCVDVAKH
jgi:outer membrane protein assembly factor BamB